MRAIEEMRQKVTEEEVKETIEILKKEEEKERAKKVKREATLQPAAAV
jgi:hypothetical protein